MSDYIRRYKGMLKSIEVMIGMFAGEERESRVPPAKYGCYQPQIAAHSGSPSPQPVAIFLDISIRGSPSMIDMTAQEVYFRLALPPRRNPCLGRPHPVSVVETSTPKGLGRDNDLRPIALAEGRGSYLHSSTPMGSVQRPTLYS